MTETILDRLVCWGNAHFGAIRFRGIVGRRRPARLWAICRWGHLDSPPLPDTTALNIPRRRSIEKAPTPHRRSPLRLRGASLAIAYRRQHKF
jgi:hypothetical protein